MYDDNSFSIHGAYVYYGYSQSCLSASMGNLTFIFCAYLIVIDYIDDKLARKLNELNIEIKEKQADTSLTDSIKAFLSEVQL